MINEYQCAMCHNTYERILTDEETLKEKNMLFSDVDVKDCKLICDECFNILQDNI